MSAITIRKLPDHVHDALRRRAKEEGKSVEAVAREALENHAAEPPVPGVVAKQGLFERIDVVRKELGMDYSDWPEWDESFDDPAFSRQMLGLEPEDCPTGKPSG